MDKKVIWVIVSALIVSLLVIISVVQKETKITQKQEKKAILPHKRAIRIKENKTNNTINQNQPEPERRVGEPIRGTSLN